tara:strand:+ start:113 stop:595 length:483 start_codon:yes stop_codon:yes gene_type:complete
MSFSSQLKSFTDKTERNGDKVFRGSLISLFSRATKRTPVGNPENWVYFDKSTGRYVDYISARGNPEGYIGGSLRGNWQASIGSPARGVVSGVDKTGAATIAKIAMVATTAKLGNTAYLVNNLPYAKKIEEGGSTQAPEGMVRVSVSEFDRIVKKQARGVK